MIFIQIQLKRNQEEGSECNYYNYEFGTYNRKSSRYESKIDFAEDSTNRDVGLREDYFVKNKEFKRILCLKNT